MSGLLYLVATPIGNLGDITARALATLESVDFIAAEDTRVTLKLLNHFEIKKPMVSYYEHNRTSSGIRILERLLSGESCALVTDAGMPAISDPGEDMARLCAENGVQVIPIPGPNAAVTALAVSALPTQRFCFEGFLSTSKRSRDKHLDELRRERRTMVFYEAPHKLMTTLRDLLDALGDRDISVCRELTKLHEEILRTTLSGAIAHFEQTPPRGEFVLVLRGADPEPEEKMPKDDVVKLIFSWWDEGRPLKEAVKMAAELSGYSRNELYALAIEEDRMRNE